MSGFFNEIDLAPPNSILGVALECKKDNYINKIDLTVGAYRDDNGKPHVLNVVRESERIIYESKMDHEYLPQDGYNDFNLLSQKLAFGDNSELLSNGKLYTIQGISGTGSLRLAAEFISKFLRNKRCYIPKVTWPGHPTILEDAGCSFGTYRYLDSSGCALDFVSMTEDLRSFPNGSIILFHSCAHNPSGVDPSQDQWIELLEICKSRNYLTVFDNAYQGFVSGDPEKDAYAIRLFANSNMEMIVACSFAKNFGLYGDRVGALHIVTSSSIEAQRIASQLRVISRSLYSTCPSHGARIVALILGDKLRRISWQQECAAMANRILSVREALYDTLVAKNVKGNWSHIVSQNGMFSYTGIQPDVVERLKNDYHIYMLSNGRISVAGLNTKNINIFVNALIEILGTN
eukprot:gene17162-22677_t